MLDQSITAYIGSYARPHLTDIVEAIKAQSVPAKEIIVVHTSTMWPGDLPTLGVKLVCCNWNAGPWFRFFVAASAETKCVAVFDDDTIPGKRWFESCLHCMADEEALYGAAGVIFPSGSRMPREYLSWNDNWNTVMEADIVGHAWFMPTGYAQLLTQAPRGRFLLCGEDYYLSALAQWMGKRTLVPPRPEGHPELWGSTHGELGMDEAALWSRPGEEENKKAWHDRMLKEGWKPMALRNK